MAHNIWIARALLISGLCALMVGAHLIDVLLGGSLKSFGIHPRDMGSAYTIVTAPWLHGSFTHLGSNLAAFVVLGALCMLNGIRYFLKASALIIIVGGALVWLFGRDATHIGASGWIFGLWSLAIALAWFDRSFGNIAISIAVIFFYGGMVWGVLPTQAYISFESHLFGAVAGVFAAFILSNRQVVATPPMRPTPRIKFWP